jgi:hypothetical protein
MVGVKLAPQPGHAPAPPRPPPGLPPHSAQATPKRRPQVNLAPLPVSSSKPDQVDTAYPGCTHGLPPKSFSIFPIDTQRRIR